MPKAARLSVDWIHPSYRDLVIEELAGDAVLRRAFLRGMSTEGLKLALSPNVTGQTGFLLVDTAESLAILEERCATLVNEGSLGSTMDLLEVLHGAATSAASEKDRQHIAQLLEKTCNFAAHTWSEPVYRLSASILRRYSRVSVPLNPLPPIPHLTASWDFSLGWAREHLDECRADKLFEPYPIEQWLDLAQAISENEPRFLRQVGFPQAQVDIATSLVGVLSEELQYETYWETAEELSHEIERVEATLEAVESLVAVYGDAMHAEELWIALTSRVESLRRESQERFPPDDDYYLEDHRLADRRDPDDDHWEFDVDRLFDDL